tara:strand:+ start:188 stop:376 length:189 start_codon:yes stop_codon:yes gene_type:complete
VVEQVVIEVHLQQISLDWMVVLEEDKVILLPLLGVVIHLLLAHLKVTMVEHIMAAVAVVLQL